MNSRLPDTIYILCLVYLPMAVQVRSDTGSRALLNSTTCDVTLISHGMSERVEIHGLVDMTRIKQRQKLMK